VDLSIVVIAYNEQECLRQVVEELLEHLAGSSLQSELVLVDDGSSDATASIMRELAAEHTNSERADSAIVRPVLLPQNLGIGGALRSGFDASQGKWVTWLPADGQIPPEVVTQLYARRQVAPMLTTVYRSRADHPLRTVISRSLNALIKLRTGQTAKSGGNYLFERRLWTEYAPRADDSMMISTAFRNRLRQEGIRIVEVEIDCRPRRAGSSKVLNPRAIWRTFAALVKLRRERGA
jgi:glycosyltransferase involved in cell wall biosynthesis